MPIKINNAKLNSSPDSGRAIKSDPAASASFSESFKTARVELFDGNMRELIDLVKQRGESFIKSPQESSLNAYKESVKLFLKKIKDEFLSLKEEFGCKKDGEQKVYQLVENSQAEIASLTSEALDSNKAINLLSSLDDIRGLVLDVIG